MPGETGWPHDDTDPRGIGHLDTGPMPAVRVPAAPPQQRARRGPDWSVVLTAGLAFGLAGGLVAFAAVAGYLHPLTELKRDVVRGVTHAGTAVPGIRAAAVTGGQAPPLISPLVTGPGVVSLAPSPAPARVPATRSASAKPRASAFPSPSVSKTAATGVSGSASPSSSPTPTVHRTHGPGPHPTWSTSLPVQTPTPPSAPPVSLTPTPPPTEATATPSLVPSTASSSPEVP
jgi:hypothetical protein